MTDEEDTVLNTFLSVSRDPSTIEDLVLECGSEKWTYGDLDSISSGLALQLHKDYGSRPTVAVISENHPYTLAILLATWKLSGIFVPLDCHAPLGMIKKMLENVEATCAVIPEREQSLFALLHEMKIGTMTFSQNTTMTSLSQRFLDQDAILSPSLFPRPKASSLAVYIHTSSASSVLNLKCVLWRHDSISQGARSTAKWFPRAWPSVGFDKVRALGLSPWSHAMGIMVDFGGVTVSTGGCLIMGTLLSGYPVSSGYEDRTTSIMGKGKQEMDILDRLLETALRSKPEILACVPWVFEGFRDRYQRLLSMKMESAALRVKEMLQRFKCIAVGGAALTPELLLWAREMNINVAHMMGVTEMGRPLFYTKIDHEKDPDANEGWPMEDCLIEDAEIVLIDDEGNENPVEGEFVVTSKYLTRGYLKYDNSAFSESADGRITFRTADLYERNRFGRFVWKGRRDDYIQMVSSESLDPRPIEKALNACSAVAHCCVVGNNFMKKPSDVVCLIVQPVSSSVHIGKSNLSSDELAEITRTVAAINRTLLPPLRIAWSRVGILSNGVAVPYTRKGMVFRKKLEDLFGEFVARLVQNNIDNVSQVAPNGVISDGKASQRVIEANSAGLGDNKEETAVNNPVSEKNEDSDLLHLKEQDNAVLSSDMSRTTGSVDTKWNARDVKKLVMAIVAGVLGLDENVLRSNTDTSFAELGMDSNMAVRIVNQINGAFGLHFPLNACHNLIDLTMLSDAILVELGVKDSSKAPVNPRDATLPKGEKEEVVIVGQALRLPGDINTPKTFWEALIDKRDDIMTPVPPERWDHPSFYRAPSSTSPPESGDISFEKAGFVDIAHYDNSFFGISTPEAVYISPATRLTLETVFEALEDACIPISKLKGTKMGVFVGAMVDEGYVQLLFEEKGFNVSAAYNRFYGTGFFSSAICGRLSYLLDIHGPSISVDTACSTSLVVIDQAVKYIQSGDGDSAIATTVPFRPSLRPSETLYIQDVRVEGQGNLDSCRHRIWLLRIHDAPHSLTWPTGNYVPSEASVTIILKSKSAAIRDGDIILAVIKSTEVMHGGRTQGLVSPSLDIQVSLQQSLLTKAGLDPSQIDFLETHGTGTSLGDLIEIQGINKVFRDSHATEPLILGAAKTCVGHTEMAAGLTGLLKAIGSFQNSVIPGLVHLTADNMNPSIDCEVVPMVIPTETTPLRKRHPDAPYRALILSNGFSGTMAGVIVEEATELVMDSSHGPDESPQVERVLMPFVVSAKTTDALEDYLKEYLTFCRASADADFKNICYTACVGREHYRYRFACVASDMTELRNCIEERVQSSERGHRSRGHRGNRVAFTFPGQGSQYQGMGRDLACVYSDFKDIIQRTGSAAADISGFPISSFLLDKHTSFHLTIDDNQVAQICIYVYQCSMSLWLKNIGVDPCAVLGHSSGEISAAVVAGAMSYEQGLEFVVKRAELLRSDSSRPGGMAIIAASKQTVTQLIQQSGFDGRVVIAVYNDAESHVISGDMSAVEVVLASAKTQGLRGTKLNITQGFHSPLISSGLPELEKAATKMHSHLSRLNIAIYSTVYGSLIPPESYLSPSYWIEHAKEPVRLSDAAANLILDNDVDVILDIGPQPFLWTAMRVASQGKVSLALSTKCGNDQTRAFLQTIASLFEQGVTLHLEGLLSGGPSLGRRTPLPTYPFQRQRHYPDFIPSRKNSKLTSRSLSVPNGRTDTKECLLGNALSLSSTAPSQRRTQEDLSEIVTLIIRNALEFEPSKHLEPSASLTSLGIDSIFFAQIKGRIMIELGVEIPERFLSDSFTVRELILYVLEMTGNQSPGSASILGSSAD